MTAQSHRLMTIRLLTLVALACAAALLVACELFESEEEKRDREMSEYYQSQFTAAW